jgi:XTP/dITP diphosphohydrolase
MRLLVATNNPGKLNEFRALLEGIAVVAPGDLGLAIEVEENGRTFAENAAAKARAFAIASAGIALADDSGLEVDALDGAPGVRSARFGGPGLNDRDRCLLLLERLRAFPDPSRRRARFRCCIVVAAPDGRTCQAWGTCEGIIAPSPTGEGGFGYDPIFYLPDRGLTMAQISPALKNRLSHRARAIAAVRPLLLRTFPEAGA